MQITTYKFTARSLDGITTQYDIKADSLYEAWKQIVEQVKHSWMERYASLESIVTDITLLSVVYDTTNNVNIYEPNTTF